MAFKSLLGRTLRDKVTGFTGLAESCVMFTNGNVQYALQPAIKKPKKEDDELSTFIPESKSFDHHQLEQVDGALTLDPGIPDSKEIAKPLGGRVRDSVSGFEGVLYRRVIFLNGCIYYWIEGKYNAEKAKADSIFVEAARVEPLPAPAAIAETRGRVGGPSFAVPSIARAGER